MGSGDCSMLGASVVMGDPGMLRRPRQALQLSPARFSLLPAGRDAVTADSFTPENTRVFRVGCSVSWMGRVSVTSCSLDYVRRLKWAGVSSLKEAVLTAVRARNLGVFFQY